MEQLGFQMFGAAGKTMVEVAVIGFLMGTAIAFFVVIGDLSPLIVSKIFNLQGYSANSVRNFLIVLITLTVVIPLCFQKSIESLSFVCQASIGFYICLTLKTVFESFERFENDENWSKNIELWNSRGVLQCIPIFSMSMSCQMQLFEVYETMSGSFDRIKRTVHQATFICCVVYCIVGFFGYLAFYNQTLSGNVLMNFSPSLANDAITIGFILSIACSFPLVIFPCRTSLASFLHRKSLHSEFASYVPESKYQPLTLFIIFSTMILGILIPSVDVIISLVGSTIGILVCVIFPATCFVKIMKRSSAEKTFAQVIIICGFIIMILGTYANLIAIDTAKSGSHLEEKLPKFEAIIQNQKDVQGAKPPVELPPSIVQQENVKDVKEVVKEVPIKNVRESKQEDEVKISADGIKKEEQEIAAEKKTETKDPQAEIQEKNEEIEVLKESKSQLEKEVKEMKEVLVKQNKETQELVLQKFEEIAEKVEKIEKQSLEGGPSAREKLAAEDKEKLLNEEVKAAVEIVKNSMVEVEKASEIHEKALEEGEKAAKDPVKLEQAPPLVLNNLPANDTAKKTNQTSKVSDLNMLEVEPQKVVEEVQDKLKPSNDVKQAPETRVDPIVKLIKSQEPLSYQVGEKMMENKKVNVSNPEAANPKLDSSENEIKNEMRKKRETEEKFDKALNSLDKTLKNFEIQSMTTRDLKAVDNE